VISSTGVGGLTLGGGLGWLMGKYGLAADNLVGAELVTAEGEVLGVSEETHPDLMWALRGGGGNFGVVTDLHVPGAPARDDHRRPDRPPDRRRAGAPALLPGRRRRRLGRPDRVRRAGAGAGRLGQQALRAGHLPRRRPEAAERELAPFKAFGSPLVTEVGPMPYPVINTMLDAGFPKGSLNYWLSSFTKGLSDTLIDTAVERYASVPSPMTPMLFEHFHGAVTRIEPTATAVPHREPGWNLLIPTVWTDPADTEANIAWTKETHAALKPGAVGAALAQLPRRRPGRGRHPRRLRPELRPATRGQAPVRPGERLPPEPQHRAPSPR
jgi:hypothetical protein